MNEPFAIEFTNNPVTAIQTRCIAVVQGVESVGALFTALKKGLRFPPYFGENWNALYDCLMDLTWLSENEVVIYHCDLPKISGTNLREYIKLLNQVGSEWAAFDDRQFRVIFPLNVRPVVERCLPRTTP